ncbi:MAG: DNA repair protein RecO [Bacilli bacterium]|jgi:DNA repair protein RecO (recombination protein O)|nr:DNA repair protein RecO [Bacilli bacterium]MDD3388869.1 DNA repair protein RecO [Bacilli bacterium]MDD4344677.1 DNA repair protein RecO [Bacilli bacterium]MDD4520549.1 DNA repair protein RecO [Bacilli bacterium]MDY0399241.1 DNA repair protein RecO [Bacilli bacterium]
MEVATAIILRVTPFKEKDAMITAITPEGYLSFLARGAFNLQGKNAPAMQKFMEVELELTEGKAHGLTLRRATIIYSSSSAMRSLLRMSALEIIGEVILKSLMDNRDVANIYPYLQSSIRLISQEAEPLSQVFILMAITLRLSGYGLDVDQCVRCGSKKAIVAVNFLDGGFVCQSCFDQEHDQSQTEMFLKMARFAFKCQPEDLSRANFPLMETLAFISEFQQLLFDNLGISLKSYRLLIEAVHQ